MAYVVILIYSTCGGLLFMNSIERVKVGSWPMIGFILIGSFWPIVIAWFFIARKYKPAGNAWKKIARTIFEKNSEETSYDPY